MKQMIEKTVKGVILLGTILLVIIMIAMAIKDAWKIIIVFALGLFGILSGCCVFASGGVRKIVLEKQKVVILFVLFAFIPIIFAFRCGIGFVPITDYGFLQTMFAFDSFFILIWSTDLDIVLPRYKLAVINLFIVFGGLCGIKVILSILNAPFGLPSGCGKF